MMQTFFPQFFTIKINLKLKISLIQHLYFIFYKRIPFNLTLFFFYDSLIVFDSLAGDRMRAHTWRFFRLASARLGPRAWGARVRTSYSRVRPHPGSARRLMNDQAGSRGAQPIITSYRSEKPHHFFLSSSFSYARLFSRDRAWRFDRMLNGGFHFFP